MELTLTYNNRVQLNVQNTIDDNFCDGKVFTVNAFVRWLYSHIERSAFESIANSSEALLMWSLALKQCGFHNIADSSVTLRKLRKAHREYVDNQVYSIGDAADLIDGLKDFKSWLECARLIAKSAGLILPEDITLACLEAEHLPEINKININGYVPAPKCVNSLLERLENTGCLVMKDVFKEPITGSAYKFKNKHEEISFALSSIEMQNLEPEEKALIVCDDLSLFDEIKEAMLYRWGKKHCMPCKKMHDEPYAISEGLWLIESGVSQVLLSMLKAIKFKNDNVFWSSLIQSKYIGDAKKELKERDKAAKYLRENVWHSVNLSGLITIMTEKEFKCPSLINALSVLKSIRIDQEKSFTEWSNNIYEIWKRALTNDDLLIAPDEYKAISHCFEVLEELKSIDRFKNLYSYGEVISIIERRFRAQLYQRYESNSQITLVTPEEAAGLNSDYTVCVGMSDELWGKSKSNSGLIPNELLMPCEPDKIIELIRLKSKSVIWTYHEYDEDKFFRINQALVDLDIELISQKTNGPTPLKIEQVPFENVPLEGNQLRNAISTLENQSQCPAKGFAVGRLQMERARNQCWGMDARERSNIMHKALELLWGEIKTSEKLKSMDNEKLKEMVTNYWIEAESEVLGWRKYQLNSGVLVSEKSRGCSLIMELLEIDKERQNFVVKHVEKKVTTEVSDLKIDLIIDREDQIIETEEILIIDYKRYSWEASEWLKKRLTSMQIPMYSNIQGQSVDGGVLATMANGKAKYVGISDSIIIEGKNDVRPVSKFRNAEDVTFKGLKESWSNKIKVVADEVKVGVLNPSPYNENENCKNCHLKGFCGWWS
ncbi:hypothetical protein A3715_17810 [Oleiphilus sp. HI0009]|nr:hypothetical protein A3715_17810 [Oleiphilus sp. HI0009]